jgi:hypothetical protein
MPSIAFTLLSSTTTLQPYFFTIVNEAFASSQSIFDRSDNYRHFFSTSYLKEPGTLRHTNGLQNGITPAGGFRSPQNLRPPAKRLAFLSLLFPSRRSISLALPRALVFI